MNQSIWRNIHLYFFYLFLLSIPFQTRKVFLTEYSFYSGEFTEWTTFFIYASDIFLILSLVFWVISILRSKNYQFKNIVFPPFVIPAKLVLDSDRGAGIHSYNKIRLFSQVFKNKWLFLFVFLFWLVLNLAINKEYFEISAFQVAKFIELSLLMIFVYFNLQNSKVLIKSLFILAFSGFLQSLIAIYQFIAQHSAFSSPILAKITGESIISPQILGVAKILIDNDKIIRAYGTFPHPNVLGGFLIFTILITIYLYLEHKKYNLSSIRLNLTYRNLDFFAEQRQVNACSSAKQAIYFEDVNSLYNTKDNKSQVCIGFLFWTLLLLTQFTGLFFTFSRSAWLGLLLSLLIISAFYFYNYKIVSRETIFNKIVNNFYSAFYKFIIVSRETICKMYQIFIDCFLFVLYKIIKKSTSIGNKNKIIKQNLIYNSCKSENVVNKRDSDNNITFLNKLLTVFQHNFYIRSIIRYKELFIALIIIIFVISINLPLVLNRLDIDLYNGSSISNNSALNERIFYNNVSRETISNNFVFGSGAGTFIFQIDNYLQANNINQKLQPWQYQPAHNIYFLIASEIGVDGLVLLLLLIISILYNSSRRNFNIPFPPCRSPVCRQAGSSSGDCDEKTAECLCSKPNLLTIDKNNVSCETISRKFYNCKISSIFVIPAKAGIHYYNRARLLTRGFMSNLKLLESKWIPDKFLRRCSKIFWNDKKNENVSLVSISKNVSRETFDNNLNIYLFAILIAFLFIGLFDHYFWTLQQGRLMFWLVLGLMLSVSDYKK